MGVSCKTTGVSYGTTTFIQSELHSFVDSAKDLIVTRLLIHPEARDGRVSIGVAITASDVSPTDQGLAHLHQVDVGAWISTKDREVLDEAVSSYTRATALLPKDHPSYPRALCHLGAALTMRGSATNDLAELSAGIGLQQDALNGVPRDHPEYRMMLLGLSASFGKRFEKTQSSTDLLYLSMISKERLMLDLETGRIDKIETLHRCAVLQITLAPLPKAGGDNDVRGISSAISGLETILEITGPQGREYPERLSLLSRALSHRFSCTRDYEDLQKAIDRANEAIRASDPDGDEKLVSRLRHLGDLLADRFRVEEDIEDLNRSIEVLERALGIAQVHDHHALPSLKVNLAHTILERYMKTDDRTDLPRALALGVSVAEDPDCIPLLRLFGAYAWATAATEEEDVVGAREGCRMCLELLRECSLMEQAAHERFANLSKIAAIGFSCTGAALKLGDVGMAAEYLEQGRCIVWSQLDRFQYPVGELRARHPSLADRFERAAHALQSGGGRRRESALPFSAVSESGGMAVEREQVNLAKEWKGLLDEIRSYPEFSTFLEPRRVAEMVESLPPGGYVVQCSFTRGRCDALVHQKGKQLVHIRLPELSGTGISGLSDALADHLRSTGVRSRGESRGLLMETGEGCLTDVLAQLWSGLAKPILDELGLSVCRRKYALFLVGQANVVDQPASDPSKRPRVWWCPTGRLSFLPLHAAGVYGQQAVFGSCLSDYVVSSYTPNVNLLVRRMSEDTSTLSAPQLLLVSQPNTPGLAPIPATVEEVSRVRTLVDQAGVRTTLLANDDATRLEVGRVMKTHNWVHFSSHAVQDAKDALNSGIHVHDGRLELEDIIRGGIPGAEHAFLSACQTGAGDKGLAEEAVHIAAGMLAVGYRGVVGSLWSIQDCHAPKVCADFYQYLVRVAMEKGYPRGLDYRDSAMALDYAVQNLRRELGDDEDALLVWVPYVHFGA